MRVTRVHMYAIHMTNLLLKDEECCSPAVFGRTRDIAVLLGEWLGGGSSGQAVGFVGIAFLKNKVFKGFDLFSAKAEKPFKVGFFYSLEGNMLSGWLVEIDRPQVVGFQQDTEQKDAMDRCRTEETNHLKTFPSSYEMPYRPLVSNTTKSLDSVRDSNLWLKVDRRCDVYMLNRTAREKCVGDTTTQETTMQQNSAQLGARRT